MRRGAHTTWSSGYPSPLSTFSSSCGAGGARRGVAVGEGRLSGGAGWRGFLAAPSARQQRRDEGREATLGEVGM